MLYIVTALKSEAQAFVDKYTLKKKYISGFTMFRNDSLVVIVSGIGVNNATQATQTLINYFDITDNDIYLNVGICGANKKYLIGELLEIGTLIINGQAVNLPNKSTLKLTCVEEEINAPLYDIVDMESYGFYDAVIHSPAIKNYYVLKVVSDHFEPETITKDMTKSLIFNALDSINEVLYKKTVS